MSSSNALCFSGLSFVIVAIARAVARGDSISSRDAFGHVRSSRSVGVTVSWRDDGDTTPSTS